MKRTALITGGTGFLGRRIGIALKDRYYVVLTGRNHNVAKRLPIVPAAYDGQIEAFSFPAPLCFTIEGPPKMTSWWPFILCTAASSGGEKWSWYFEDVGCPLAVSPRAAILCRLIVPTGGARVQLLTFLAGTGLFVAGSTFLAVPVTREVLIDYFRSWRARVFNAS